MTWLPDLPEQGIQNPSCGDAVVAGGWWREVSEESLIVTQNPESVDPVKRNGGADGNSSIVAS